jgi:hypothetical protein
VPESLVSRSEEARSVEPMAAVSDLTTTP